MNRNPSEKIFRRAPAKRRSHNVLLRVSCILALLTAAAGITVVLGVSPVQRAPGNRALPVTVFPASADDASSVPAKPLDVPFLSQLPDYPTGCESVSAVMALQYFGVDLDPGTFIDEYLPLGTAPYRDDAGTLRGCDPREAFPGDPRSELGWGCCASVIARALESAAGPELTVRELSGVPPEALCRQYTDRRIPALLWVTVNMTPAVEGGVFLLEDTDEPYSWIEPMHCALLTGWDDAYYYFNDPLAEKNTPYPREAVEAAYDALGKQAVVLLPRKSEVSGISGSDMLYCPHRDP